ncbi:14655_t:CDS:2, partial [Rhizophagus irregularis]
HLENCPYWAERHSSEETQAIIQKAMEYDNDFDEGKTEVLTPLSSTSTPSQEQIETFEQLLLDVTVACDFAFRWVDNPAVKELFKWLNPMLELPDRAISLITFFSRSKVWLGRLQNEQAAIYKVHIALVTSATTRWNSYYYCFASLLKTKGALRNLATKIDEKIISDGYDFPEKHLQCILDNN